jgi:hypothetical protein
MMVLALIAAAGPRAAMAQTYADITHRDLSDTTKYGPVNSVYGYAWGSYTCNIGTGSLSWVNGGSPALAMNAYRLHDGRLVQIGLGFCKHACCVGNGAGCGLTCSSSGFGLRPGCQDYYSAGFNGGTTRLGPRSGINAYTGTFTSIASGTGDAIWRHVQISTAAMDPAAFPGAQYFAEGEYVCSEELPADKLNNATYRPCLVANTGATPTYNWTVTGVSATGRPAIWAWREHGLGLNQPDTSVTVVNADVPGEGRFVVAGKVRALGNRTWRYDYAVFNLNSHRSGATLEVPIAPDAVVTNIGFSAPLYHSGEVYSNAPWTGAKSGNRVIFSAPEKYEGNPNTNALRWGTMYTFWFTANVPPSMQPGQLGLTLFRPGTPTGITIAGLPVSIPCRADYDTSGTLAVPDIYTFLSAWFAADPSADFNGINGINEQDIFDFVGGWFAGC